MNTSSNIRHAGNRPPPVDTQTYEETTLDYDCPFQDGQWVIYPEEYGDQPPPNIRLWIGGEIHLAGPGSEKYNQAIWYSEHPECGFVIRDPDETAQ